MGRLEQRLLELEQNVQGLEGDLYTLRSLISADHASALNKIRFITEKVLHRLCDEHSVSWGKSEPTLENMIGPLAARGTIPRSVVIHIRTIQMNASPGSHYQSDPLRETHVQVAQIGLVEFLEWYHSQAPSPDGGTERPPTAPRVGSQRPSLKPESLSTLRGPAPRRYRWVAGIITILLVSAYAVSSAIHSSAPKTTRGPSADEVHRTNGAVGHTVAIRGATADFPPTAGGPIPARPGYSLVPLGPISQEYVRAGELRSAQNFVAALDIYQRIFDETHEPRALAQIGITEAQMGRWVVAEEHLVAAMATDDRWIRTHRETFTAALSVVQSHLGLLAVNCNVQSADLQVNGVSVGRLPHPAVRVSRGPVVIDVIADGYEPHRETAVASTALTQVEVTLVPRR